MGHKKENISLCGIILTPFKKACSYKELKLLWKESKKRFSYMNEIADERFPKLGGLKKSPQKTSMIESQF